MSRGGAAAACALATVCGLPAQAQDAVRLSEVIVTARKSPERTITVPVVIAALPQERLESLQAYDLKDLASLVPGMTVGGALPAFGTQVSIRGVGTTAAEQGADQSVALVIDGLQLTQGVAYSSGLFDVDQVEVLKGPQALFYGRASTGGVISIRTADPTDTAELQARVGYEFEANEWRSELIVSGPLGDDLKLRLAGLYASQDGYFTNAATGLAATGARDPASRRLFPSRGYQLRATVLATPSSRLTARLKLNLVHERTRYAATRQYVLCPDGTGAPFGVPFLGGGEDCKLDRTYRAVDYDLAVFPGIESPTPYFEATQAYGTLELDYQLAPALTLTSVTGSYKLDSQVEVNGTNSTYAAPDVVPRVNVRMSDFSQELRLNSDSAGRANFTLGGYYETGSLEELVAFIGNQRLGAPPILAKGVNDLDMRTYAIFGQLRWQLTPQVELAAGARWQDERRSVVGVDLASGAPVAVAAPRPVLRASNISPELTLTYQPNAQVMAFAALKRGYKSGSFSITFPPTPADNAYDEEKVEGGELGLKTRLFDRRLAADFAAYDYRYSDMQVPTVFFAAGGVPSVRTINSGRARVYGLELDVAYRPPAVEALNLRAAANWNHGRFERFDNAPCYLGQTIAAGCNQALDPATGLFTAQDLSGTPLIRAPAWQASFGFDYERPIGHGLTLSLNSNSRYSSRYKATLSFPYYQPAYLKTDLGLAVRGPRDRWELALIGKNLGDKLTTGACGNLNAQSGNLRGGAVTGGTGRGPSGVDEIACFVDRGREVWLRLTLRPLG
ncbi:TonB-dependent receptor [Phenylobacterium sp. LjRoot219]|uniref:TonB-dependent receptor n=1 Tax=Phenylobacterium sp. LjRoot219 TaxID=3342283 RepID=UPI003ED1317F